MSKLKTHWVADIFPLNQADVDAIADDIKANGQKIPIQQLADGRVVDGRNRWLACEKVGVKPVVETVAGNPNDDELLSLALSLNGKRRSLTAAARACAAAEALEHIAYGEKRKALATVCSKFDSGKVYTTNALTLLRNDRARFDRVKAGEPVDPVYKEYQEEKAKADQRTTQLALIQSVDGLAERLERDEVSFTEALTLAEKAKADELAKEAAEEESRNIHADWFAELFRMWDRFASHPNAGGFAAMYDPDRVRNRYKGKASPALLAELGRALIDISTELES